MKWTVACGGEDGVDLRQIGRDPLLARGEAEAGALTFLPKLAGKFDQLQCNSIGNTGTRQRSMMSQNCRGDRARPRGRGDGSRGSGAVRASASSFRVVVAARGMVLRPPPISDPPTSARHRD